MSVHYFVMIHVVVEKKISLYQSSGLTDIAKLRVTNIVAPKDRQRKQGGCFINEGFATVHSSHIFCLPFL